MLSVNRKGRVRWGYHFILLFIFSILFIYAFVRVSYSPIKGGFGEELWVYRSSSGFDFKEVAFEDVVGDAEREVVVLTWGDVLSVLNGSDGSLLWSYKFESESYLMFGDLDGDGKKEVIIYGFDSLLSVFDGDGSQLWNFSKSIIIYDLYVSDVDGDGCDEIIVGGITSNNYNLSIVVLDGDGEQLWNFSELIINYDLYVSDIDGDGVLEIVLAAIAFGEGVISIHVFESYNGETLWVSKVPKLGDWFNITFGYINGDSYTDLIVYGAHIGSSTSDSINFYSNIYSISGLDGLTLWNISFSEVNITKRYVQGWPFDYIKSPIVLDLNGDGWGDVILTSLKGKVYVLDGHNGTILWDSLEVFDLVKSVSILDVDADGEYEVFIESLSSVSVLAGSSGNIIWYFPSTLYGFKYIKWASVGDIDNNNVLDFVVGVSGKKHQGIIVLYGDYGGIAWNITFTYPNDSLVYDSFSKAALADLDGDGSSEIVVVIAPFLYVFDGDGTVLWSYKITGNGPYFVVLMDLDANGGLEVIVATEDELYVLGFHRRHLG